MNSVQSKPDNVYQALHDAEQQPACCGLNVGEIMTGMVILGVEAGGVYALNEGIHTDDTAEIIGGIVATFTFPVIFCCACLCDKFCK